MERATCTRPIALTSEENREEPNSDQSVYLWLWSRRKHRESLEVVREEVGALGKLMRKRFSRQPCYVAVEANFGDAAPVSKV